MSTIVVRERERDRQWEEGSHRSSEPRSYRTVRRYRVPRTYDEEDDYRVVERERRVERGDQERTLQVVRRVEREREPVQQERSFELQRTVERGRDRPYELDRFSRSTEYFSQPEPAPQPIIVRQQAAPQQIIIQEVQREPIIIRREVEPSYELIQRSEVDTDRQQLARRPREAERYEEYDYEREERTVDRPRRDRDRDRDEEFYYERDVRREVSPRDSASQYGHGDRDDREYSSDDDVVVVKRETRDSHGGRDVSPHHRRHVAEGALAGLGAAALLTHHKQKEGEEVPHRGRKILGATAAGALGAEVLSRARSQRRSHESRHDERRRSRSHSRVRDLATLGLGAAAVAAAVKYAKDRNSEGKKGRRSRSRRRRHSVSVANDDYNSDDQGEIQGEIRHNQKHRTARIAEAALGSAAVVGLVEHARHKSQERHGGRSRSRSRLRTGLPIAVAALGGAGVAGLYEKHKAKGERQQDGGRRSRSRTPRSRSRSRSVGYSDRSRSVSRGAPASSPEGLIEYGNEPIYTNGGAAGDYYATPPGRGYQGPTDNLPTAAAAATGAAYGASRHRSRSRSVGRDYDSSSSYSSDDRRHKRGSRRRSHSRGEKSKGTGKALAEAGLAAGAAGLAAHELTKRKERKRAEREQRERAEASPDHNQGPYQAPPPPPPAGYPPENYYPQTNNFPPPPNSGYPTPNYNPQDYVPPVPPVGPAPNVMGGGSGQVPDPYGYPRHEGEPYVSERDERSADNVSPITAEDGLKTHTSIPPPPPPPQNKGVQFNTVTEAVTPGGSKHLHRDRTGDTEDYGFPPSSNDRSRHSHHHDQQPSSSSSSTSRKDRSQPVAQPGESDSEDTIVLPDRFDKYGRPVENRDARVGDRLENILNGRAAGSFFRRIFD